jgi:uncharacterized damage-inducible protein DinB
VCPGLYYLRKMIARKYCVESGVGQNEIADMLIAVKHDARATTLRYIKGVTPEELDWQPYPGWNSIGALLSHIIACDKFRMPYLRGEEITEAFYNSLKPGLELGKYVEQLRGNPLAYYEEQLMQAFTAVQEAIKKVPAEKWLERRYDEYDKENGSDLAWVIYHNAEDEVHHRGQISILRKLYKAMRSGR